MTTEPSDADIEPVTQEDLKGFADHLAEWGANLPPKEKAILALMLSQAREQADVAGFSQGGFATAYSSAAVANLSPVFARGIGIRGFNGASADWMNFGWQKSSMPSARYVER